MSRRIISSRDAKRKLSPSLLLKRSNRGLLLDVVVLFANLFLMRMLTRQFIEVIKAADAGDRLAGFGLFLMCASLMVLAPAGAVLKRWHFHERLRGKNVDDGAEMMGGCLFNPIFYFCLTAVIFSATNAFILQFIAKGGDPGPVPFVSSLFIGLGLMIAHTFLVYRYFSPPKHPPESPFLRDTRSEIVGDVLIFVNMLIFQLVWNLLAFSGLPRPSGVFDVVARLFVLCFIALLLYFPPRIFYLAEDIRKPRTWVMIMLANSPVIFRVLVGTDTGAVW